jgi:hypothetical protein
MNRPISGKNNKSKELSRRKFLATVSAAAAGRCSTEANELLHYKYREGWTL